MKPIRKKSEVMKNVEMRYRVELEELLRRLYVDENKTIHQISSEIGISYVTASKWLDMAGIRFRRIEFDEGET